MNSYRPKGTLTPVEACHSISRWGRYQWPQMWVSDPNFEIEWAFEYDQRVCHLRFLRQDTWRTQKIHLRGIPQKFGGEMFLLVCPKCDTNRGKLFLPDNWYLDWAEGILVWHFLCRDCYRLTYLQRRRGLVNQVHAQEYRLERHRAKFFQETADADYIYKKPNKHYDQFEKQYAKYQDIVRRKVAADEVWGEKSMAKLLRSLRR